MTRDDHGATTTPSSRRNITSKVGCPAGAAGTGPLGDGLVTRLIPGITNEWIVLDDGTRVTPGHRYLRPDGSFMAIADIVASDGRVVDAHGRVTRVTGSLLRAADAGSDATWIEPDPIDVGGICALSREGGGRFNLAFEIATGQHMGMRRPREHEARGFML